MTDIDRIRAALSTVMDPDVGQNIVDLGLVERIEVLPGRVQVTLVPTSATCPMADLILEEAESAVRGVSPPATEVEVAMDWEQDWSPARMSDALRKHFGW